MFRTRHPHFRWMTELLGESGNSLNAANEFADRQYGLPLDLEESADAYLVRASLPGVRLDDISVSIHDDVLTIAAEIRPSEAAETARLIVRERRGGRFTRSIRFPLPVRGDAIEAHLDSGVLTVTAPKADEAKPRQIAVSAVSSS